MKNSNGKNLKIEPIDSNLRDKCIAYCNELHFGIIPPSCFFYTETINIISSDTEININECISNELFIIPKKIFSPNCLGYVNLLIKQAKEKVTTEDCIWMVKILKNAMIKKEIKETFNSCDKQWRSEYMKLV